MTGNEKTLSVSEAAEIAGVSRQSIYVAIKAGRLSAKRKKRIWYINAKSVKEYAESLND